MIIIFPYSISVHDLFLWSLSKSSPLFTKKVGNGQ